MSEPFIGEIRLVGFDFAPRGWESCEGQLLSIHSNQTLFSLLGTTYGGDGVHTFALPDLRGRVPIGEGTGPGLTPYRLGERGGSETVTLTESQMPSHDHAASATTTLHGSDSAANSPSPNGTVPGNTGRSNLNQTESATVDRATDAASTTVTVQNAGGSQPHNNIQPYLGMRYVIATQGIYPSRS